MSDAQLSAQLTRQEAINDFIKGKTDREIAVTGLSMFDMHVDECNKRWQMVYNALKYIGLGVGLIFLTKIADEFHSGPIHDLAKSLLLSFSGG